MVQKCTLAMNIIKRGHAVVTTNYHQDLSVLTGATVMAPNVKVFLQVALLCYVVTTSIKGIIDFQDTCHTSEGSGGSQTAVSRRNIFTGD